MVDDYFDTEAGRHKERHKREYTAEGATGANCSIGQFVLLDLLRWNCIHCLY